ncbi:MAG: hypothetical protein JSS75_00315 [Bacteroidetes bacterium]|nr:hypothetical protein [Bacteroidota bacterium]
MNTTVTASSVLGRSLALLCICGLFSCSQPSSGPNEVSVVPTFQKDGAMRAQSDDKKKDKKLSIRNKSKHDVTVDVTFDSGDADSFSCNSGTNTDYQVGGTASALSLNSTSISSNTATTITLSDGSQITVTWDGNVIVVVDTLEMN